MSNNLRLRRPVESAFFLVFAVVSAVPMEQSERKRRRRVGKREEKNSGSLEQAIEDAVHLDKDILAGDDSHDEDEDSDDSDDDDQSSHNDSRNKPIATVTSVPSTIATARVRSSALPAIAESNSGSSTTRNLAIAGGTVGGLIFLALIGFALYRWRTSNKNKNSGPWNDEKYPPSLGGPVYQTPPSTLFGGGSSQRNDPIPRMPTMPKPPPLVLVPQDRSFQSRGYPAERVEDGQTFFFESDSNRGSNLPPIYDELRSPSMESSISQTLPYPNRNATRKLYASFQPPPIPESPAAAASDPNQTRFSWTTKRTSVDSAPKFRGVMSWVNYQTGRMSMKEKLAKLGLEEAQAPATPVAFRHHPGAPVSFLAQHSRQESAELDRQCRLGR